MCGGRPVDVRTREEDDYALLPSAIEARITPRTKVLVLITPNNPTGAVTPPAMVREIAALAIKYGLIVISDEIYAKIVFEGSEHLSIGSLPGMRERTITISGLSKTFSVTGWRIGYLIAPPELTDGIRKVHDFLTVGAPAPLQEAAAGALDFDDAFYDDLRALYGTKRDVLMQGLTEAGFEVVRPQGAYYIMADIRPFGATDDTEFARFLTAEIGVAPVPGSSFYSNQELGRTKVRFTFSKSAETLRLAAERLTALRVRA